MTEPVETPSTPPSSAGVEWKVKAATAASYVFGVVALWLMQLLTDGDLVSTYSTSYLPPSLSAFVLPLVPALATFAAGWITKHTPRASGFGPDADARIEALVSVVEARIEERLRGQLAAARSTHNRTGDL